MKTTKLMLRAAGALALLAFATPALPCEAMRGATTADSSPAADKTKEKEKIAAKTTTAKPGEKQSAKTSEKSVKN